MEVFSGYFMTIKPKNLIISVLLPRLFCFYIYFFSDSKNPNAGFSYAGAGYTFTPLSINTVGFFSL